MKDREDPPSPATTGEWSSIQYQESATAWPSSSGSFAHLHGSAEAALADGLLLDARSEPYAPPNPEALPPSRRRPPRLHPANRRSSTSRAAPTSSQRPRGPSAASSAALTATAGPSRSTPPTWRAASSCGIDGEARPCDPSADSYAQVLAAFGRWAGGADRESLMRGLYPNSAVHSARLSALLGDVAEQPESVRVPKRAATTTDLASYNARQPNG